MIGSFFRAWAPALVLSGACVTVFDAAAEYPDRPIRYIVPVPVAVGGAGDISARLLTAELAIQMNQPFVIDNRASSGGIIGVRALILRVGALPCPRSRSSVC